MLRSSRCAFGVPILISGFLCGADAFAQPALPPTPLPSVPGFKELVTELPRSFQNLASAENLELLGAGSAIAWLGGLRDNRLSSRRPENALEEALDGGGVLGGSGLQLGVSFGTYLMGRAAHRRGIAQIGAQLVRAQTMDAVLTHGLKLAVRRTRPDGGSFSFPSGHAASAFASATVLAGYFGWRVGIPMYTVASYVAMSRVQERRHYASDVLFGASVGIIAGRASNLGRRRTTFAVSPFTMPGGAGVMLIKTSAR